MPDTFFITTAIDYTNGAPHIGHAYEKVLADVIARYQRMAGREVFFLTGVDQHGQKVQQSAEKQGVEPQEFVDGVTAKFVALWEKLDVRYDAWAATTDPKHKLCVQQILTRLNAEGHIYKDKRGGHYSVRQEQFLTDKERGEDGEFGPEWGQVEFREEENYYFRLAEHKDWLLQLIDQRSADGKPLVIPDFRVSELRNAVEKLEGDLCISRPKARLSWGIEFPFDPEFVTYVWFDALVNYISFAPGYDPAADSDLTRFKKLWPALHVIGKDILIPAHGVYWPIMLKALGFANDEIPPLLVHGWWNIAGAKMSKSLGNSVDPDALADKYGAEALRYYLMSDIATGRDSDFSEDRLIIRYNTDLANNLGNLLNRTLNMAAKYREGILRKEVISERFDSSIGDDTERAVAKTMQAMTQDMPTASANSNSLQNLRGCLKNHVELYKERMEGGATNPTGTPMVDDAMTYASTLAGMCNLLIETEKPWALAKDPEKASELDAVLYTLAESLRIIAILISPVLPKAAAAIFSQLNWDASMTLKEATWGKLGEKTGTHQLGSPTPIFPRIQPLETAS